MDKTIKQIADELGISKQTVSRYIKKNCIKPVSETASTYTFDETAQARIFTAFSQNEPYHEPLHDKVNDTVIEALLKQLEEKDRQIQEKDKQISDLQKIILQQQMLAASNIVALPDNKKSHWWQFWK